MQDKTQRLRDACSADRYRSTKPGEGSARGSDGRGCGATGFRGLHNGATHRGFDVWDAIQRQAAGIFRVCGLVLASVGVYGVIAYFVAQRTHEIGIRVALGASSRDVMGMVMRQGT